MWPWEHLAFGYVLYSGGVHLWHRRPPTDEAALVLAFATQLPDLIDKPLAWAFHVLPNGLSLAHSLLFAMPFLLIVAVITDHNGVPEWGIATVVGYLSHLAGDVLYFVATNGYVNAGFLLWPLIERPVENPPGLVRRVQDLFASFLGFLETPAGNVYLVVSIGALVAVFALWMYDGLPGFGYVTRSLGSR